MLERKAIDGNRPNAGLVEAIDWAGLAQLRCLAIRVGGLHVMEPVHPDVGCLRELPHLTDLDFYQGVEQAGSAPSPLDPRFDGLSRRHARSGAPSARLVPRAAAQ